MKRRASLVLLTLTLALALVAPALALAGGGPPGGQHSLDWPFYGNDLGGIDAIQGDKGYASAGIMRVVQR